MHILFVEDEAKIANFVRARLKEQGFVVDYCDNGDEGYSRALLSPGRAFTRTQILEHIWGYDFNPNTNVVDVCVQRIRKKIDSIGGAGWIESIH